MFFIATISMNVVQMLIFGFVLLGFIFLTASYFAAADGNMVASIGLKQAGGAACFVAGLVGW
jgi:hypothetical protein